MPIVVNLDVVMAKRKMSLNELAQRVDITLANLSILKNNHAKAVRFTTLCSPTMLPPRTAEIPISCGSLFLRSLLLSYLYS